MLIKEKVSEKFSTQGIRYEDLRKMNLKFAVRMKQIGEFVPIRFSKLSGVNLQEIGIVDIDFAGYLWNSEGEGSSVRGGIQKQENKEGKTRMMLCR